MDAVTELDDPELHALLVLDGLPGLGPRRVGRLVDTFGSAVAALAAPRRALAAWVGAAAAPRVLARSAAAVDAALTRARRAGLGALTWHADAYPQRLRHLADPPPVLFVRGRRGLLCAPAVTVVGARRATARGRDVAERLGQALVEAGVTVVSGMALGVDGAGHRGALAGGDDTVAVLGTGADVAYPRAHAALLRAVAARGLVVSEFLPGTPALPHHFPRRNRILAALGTATVVVEAGSRSGSLITVDHALDLGRDVWVVPGPIERAACAGSNRLLGEGARPLLSVDAFVRSVAPAGRGPADGAGPVDALPVFDDPLVRALAEEPLSGDELAARLGRPVQEVLRLLTALELRGAVRRLPGMRYGRSR